MFCSIRQIFTLCSIFVVFCFSLSASHLHLFVVGAAHDEDPVMLSAVKNDVEAIRSQALEIADGANLSFSEVLFFGEHIQTTNVIEAIESLDVKSNDIVIFYYSGHGFTTKGYEEDPWPILALNYNSACLPLNSVIDRLVSKNAHFTFVFADCCNTWIPDSLVSVVAWEPKNLEIAIKENYEELFLNSPGFVVLSSAKRKQRALGRSSGSYCTLAFLNSLQEHVSKKDSSPTWQGIMKDTAEGVMKFVDMSHNRNKPKAFKVKQEPVFYIQPFCPL